MYETILAEQLERIKVLKPVTDPRDVWLEFNSAVMIISAMEGQNPRNYRGLIKAYGETRDVLSAANDTLLSENAKDDVAIMITALDRSIEDKYRLFEADWGFSRN